MSHIHERIPLVVACTVSTHPWGNRFTSSTVSYTHLENEMNENKVTLKNMETGEQSLVSDEESIQTLKKLKLHKRVNTL